MLVMCLPADILFHPHFVLFVSSIFRMEKKSKELSFKYKTAHMSITFAIGLQT